MVKTWHVNVALSNWPSSWWLTCKQYFSFSFTMSFLVIWLPSPLLVRDTMSSSDQCFLGPLHYYSTEVSHADYSTTYTPFPTVLSFNPILSNTSGTIFHTYDVLFCFQVTYVAHRPCQPQCVSTASNYCYLQSMKYMKYRFPPPQ